MSEGEKRSSVYSDRRGPLLGLEREVMEELITMLRILKTFVV